MTLTSSSDPVAESPAAEPRDLTVKPQPGARVRAQPCEASEKDGQLNDHRPGTGGHGQPSTSDTGSMSARPPTAAWRQGPTESFGGSSGSGWKYPSMNSLNNAGQIPRLDHGADP